MGLDLATAKSLPTWAGFKGKRVAQLEDLGECSKNCYHLDRHQAPFDRRKRLPQSRDEGDMKTYEDLFYLVVGTGLSGGELPEVLISRDSSIFKTSGSFIRFSR